MVQRSTPAISTAHVASNPTHSDVTTVMSTTTEGTLSPPTDVTTVNLSYTSTTNSELIEPKLVIKCPLICTCKITVTTFPCKIVESLNVAITKHVKLDLFRPHNKWRPEKLTAKLQRENLEKFEILYI
ncbi:hypothetical protein CHS0354_004002 [Potamilus streckersoni]|uniref:Uncharacterized protein n=1 Tax=Potamilus streckersoni TaxID=2493646 RepID=A0AAE0S0C5_9BIVA|nr:hypothetical protein CHS0354_004002 [Potamilus streckersoni]